MTSCWRCCAKYGVLVNSHCSQVGMRMIDVAFRTGNVPDAQILPSA